MAPLSRVSQNSTTSASSVVFSETSNTAAVVPLLPSNSSTSVIDRLGPVPRFCGSMSSRTATPSLPTVVSAASSPATKILIGSPGRARPSIRGSTVSIGIRSANWSPSRVSLPSS